MRRRTIVRLEGNNLLQLIYGGHGAWSWTVTFYEGSVPDSWKPTTESTRLRWKEITPEGVSVDFWHPSQSPWRVDFVGHLYGVETVMDALREISAVMAEPMRELR